MKTSSFFISTLIAAAAMTSTAWAKGITEDTTLTNDTINENVYVGSGDVNPTLSLEGTTSITGKVYVGQDGTVKDLAATLDISGDVTHSGYMYVDDNATLNITSGNSLDFTGTNDYDFMIIGGTMNVGGELSIDGCSTRFSRATVKVAEGATITDDGQVCVYGSNVTVNGAFDITHGENMASSLILGWHTASEIGSINTTTNFVVSGANAKVTVNGGDKATTARTDIYTDENSKVGSLIVEKGGTFETDGVINNAGAISVNGGTLTAKTINNTSTFNVTGSSALKFDTFSSTVVTTFGGAEASSTLTLGSKSGNGASITASRLNIYNADVTLTDNVSVAAPTNVLHKIQDSIIDLNGKTLSYKGFVVLDSYEGTSKLGSNQGVTLSNGEFKVTNSNHLCFQGYDHVIASDAVVTFDSTTINSAQVSVYGSLTVYGQLNAKHGNYGYDLIGTTNTGWSKENYPASILTVSGENAAYTITEGHMFRVMYETENTGAGTMIIEKGATFSYTAASSGKGLFFNSNKVSVDDSSSFTVGSYYGYDEYKTHKGAFNSETAGEMVVLGSVTVNNALVTDSVTVKSAGTLTAGTITVAELTIESGATVTVNEKVTVSGTFTNAGALVLKNNAALVDGDGNALGLSIANASVTVEASNGKSVSLSSSAEGVTITSATDVTESVEISEAAGNVVAAWSFEISNNDQDVVVEMAIGSGLNTESINVWHSEDGKSWDNVTESVKVKDSWNYENGNLTFTVSDFSYYAVSGAPVPEPSAFGLLAGLGALALVAARRRRR